MAYTGSHGDEELIAPVAIRPRQTGTGGKTSASLCRIHFNKAEQEKGQRLTRSWFFARFVQWSKCGSFPSILCVRDLSLLGFCCVQSEADRNHLIRSSGNYQTPQGWTKTLLTHVLQHHFEDDEDHGPAVELEHAQLRLSSKSAAEFPPDDVRDRSVRFAALFAPRGEELRAFVYST
jgi:hypothetical protein